MCQCFTMDEKRSKAVTEAFVRLYKDGLIYRLVSSSSIVQGVKHLCFACLVMLWCFTSRFFISYGCFDFLQGLHASNCDF